MSTLFQINVHEILRTKAPKVYKKLPKFVINGLAKLIHQDDVNKLIRDNQDVTGVDFMNRMVRDLNIQVSVHGVENLPADSRCIFASNHPLGGLDGICLSAVLGNYYNKQVRYLVNDILYFIQPLQDIFIPINKHGAQAKDAILALHEALKSDNQIITFPAGLVSRKTKQVIKDTQWKKMFITKAIEYQRNVVPVYFEAHNSTFFYALANIRKRLGIKINIEMLFLPRELFKARGSSFSIYWGKPIPWQSFTNGQTPQQWADTLKEVVYNIHK